MSSFSANPCKGTLEELNRIKIRLNLAEVEENILVLDTHLYQAQRLRMSVLSEHFQTNFLLTLFSIQAKYKIKHRDFYRVIFGLDGKKQFLKDYPFTDVEIRNLNYGITQLSGPYFSLLKLLPDFLKLNGIERGKIWYLQTLNTLFESFSSDFDYDMAKREFSPRHPLVEDMYMQSLLSESSRMLTESVSQVLATKEIPNEEILAKLKFLGVGGQNGEKDRYMLSEIFKSVRTPHSSVTFVTSDKGIAKNLLKLKGLKQVEYNKALALAVDEGQATNQSLPEGVYASLYDKLPSAVGIKSPLNRTARLTWFKDLSLTLSTGETLSIDLIYCKVFEGKHRDDYPGSLYQAYAQEEK